MTEYRYTGRGRRTISESDFAKLGVDVEGGINVSEGETVELPDEVADLLIGMREPLEKVEPPADVDKPDDPEGAVDNPAEPQTRTTRKKN